MDPNKTINDGMELQGRPWRLRTPGSWLLDYALFGVLLLIPLVGWARHSGQTAEAFPVLLLLAGVTLAYVRPAGNRWAAALLLDWGFLSSLASLSWEIRLAGLSFSFQLLSLILLVLLLIPELLCAQPSRLIVGFSGFAIILFLMFLAPAAGISGALTIETPLALIYVLLFLLVLEPLRWLLDVCPIKHILASYCLILAVFTAAQWMMNH